MPQRDLRGLSPRRPVVTMAPEQLPAPRDLVARPSHRRRPNQLWGDWLAERGLSLAEAGQGDIDAWLATGPGAYQVRDFLAWAAEHGHSQP